MAYQQDRLEISRRLREQLLTCLHGNPAQQGRGGSRFLKPGKRHNKKSG